jgi:hypothetical protein
MDEPKVVFPLSVRFSDFYRNITAAAAEINAASDDLGKSIDALNESLQSLNLGVSSWVEFSDDDLCKNYIGFAKSSKGKWAILITQDSGYQGPGQYERSDTWAFNDAPRSLRLEAMEKLPDLLEKIFRDTQETIEQIKTKAAQAKALSDVINPPSRRRK